MSIRRPTNRIREAREAAGISRAELAAKISSTYGGRKGEPVSERTVYRWEIGETQIPEKQWARLAEVLRVSASHLLGLDRIDEGNGAS